MQRPVSPFEEAVHRFVQNIPKGRVATYGDVAKAIGRPGGSRAVGGVMRRNPDTHVTPCHRVVAADGTLGGYMGSQEFGARKASRLKAEGVRVDGQGRIVDFERVRWAP